MLEISYEKRLTVALNSLISELTNRKENQTIVDPLFFKDLLAEKNEVFKGIN
jgi:hypothetical protein